MTIESGGDNLYAYCVSEIRSFIKRGFRNKAEKMMGFIVETWPEKIIAKGELASEPQISDNELEIGPSIP